MVSIHLEVWEFGDEDETNYKTNIINQFCIFITDQQSENTKQNKIQANLVQVLLKEEWEEGSESKTSIKKKNDIQTCNSSIYSTKHSVAPQHKDDFKPWWKHYWLNMVKVTMDKSLMKWERLKQTTVFLKDNLVTKNKQLCSELPAGCLPCIFVLSQKYILTSSVGWRFIQKKKSPDWGNEVFVWKVEKASRLMAWTTLLDNECAIPLLKQLTMNAVQLNTAKCSKVIFLQRWMNQNLHSTSPINTSKIQAIIFGTWSWERTFESCSKQFHLQNLYFKATQFRHTCDCVAHVSGYQNVKSPKIYTNRHLFNFSEDCCFNTLGCLANILTASEFPYFLFI